MDHQQDLFGELAESVGNLAVVQPVTVNLPWTDLPSLPPRDQWPESESFRSPVALPCVLVFDGGSVGIPGFRASTIDHLRVQLLQGKRAFQDSIFGILLQFPRKQPGASSTASAMMKTDPQSHNIMIKLPPGGTSLRVRSATITGFDGVVTQLQMDIADGHSVGVHGYQLPSADGLDDVVDGWVNRNLPIEGSITLSKVLAAKEFSVVTRGTIADLQRFLSANENMTKSSYPYDFSVDFNPAKLYSAVEAMAARGPAFPPAPYYADDKALFTVLSQTVVQDFIHLHVDAEKLCSLPWTAQLVEHVDEFNPHIVRQYAVVYFKDHLPVLKQGTMPSSWIRLQNDPSFRISVPTIDSQGREAAPVVCQAKTVTEDGPFKVSLDQIVIEFESPSRQTNLAYVEKADIVLDGGENNVKEQRVTGTVSISLLFQSDRAQAERKLESLKSVLDGAAFAPDPFLSARSTTVTRRGRSRGRGTHARTSNDPHTVRISAREYRILKRLQAFHADFWQGRGFWQSCSQVIPWDTHTPRVPGEKKMSVLQLPGYSDIDTSGPVYELPSISLVDDYFRDEILANVPYKDQGRFLTYLRSARLGIAVITGFSGSGKTQALATAVVAMVLNDDIGTVYASAASNMGVSQMAARIDKVARQTVDMFNETDEEHRTYPVVIRGHNRFNEVEKFLEYVESDRESVSTDGKPDSKWSLPLSGAQWLLRIFRGELSDKESPTLRAITRSRKTSFDRVRDLLDCQPGNQRRLSDHDRRELTKSLVSVLDEIIISANVVCTTPAMANNEPYSRFNGLKAQAVAIDDANSMSRVDAISFWGNTCRPCVMAGDPKLISPTVKMTDKRVAGRQLAYSDDEDERVVYGYPYNRMVEEGSVSVLDWIRTLGWKELVLDTQMRMATGLVNPDMFYDGFVPLPSDHPCTSIANRPIYTKLDNSLALKYDLSTGRDKAAPIFVHCDNAEPETNPRTLSLFNRGQLHILLELLQQVLSAGIEPEDILILTPYAGNVKVLQGMLRAHTKLSRVPCSTVDSYQGAEAEVVLYVFTVTTNAHAAFAADSLRFNAAISRARSALILVGNLKLSMNGSVQTYSVVPKTIEGKPGLVVQQDKLDMKECRDEKDRLRALIRTLSQSGRLIRKEYKPVQKEDKENVRPGQRRNA